MRAQKRPSTAEVITLLKQYKCPTPFHAVRTRFMGSIVSVAQGGSPVYAVQELWGGQFPPFNSIDDLNDLLHVLVDGLWNRLSVHQSAIRPFTLTPAEAGDNRDGVLRYTLLRKEEIEGFLDGLFGPHKELNLPESAHDALQAIEQIRSILLGAVKFLKGTEQGSTAEDLAGLVAHLEELEPLLEQEMNTVILSCSKARRQLLAAEKRQGKPAVN